MKREAAIKQASERAAVLFRMFGWEYYDGVPTAKRLRETISGLFDTLDEKGSSMVSSGRITVHRFEDDLGVEDNIMLDLATVFPDDQD